MINLAYSADAVYLYSTRDPLEAKSSLSSILSPNKRHKTDSPARDLDPSNDSIDKPTPTRDDSLDISHDQSEDTDFMDDEDWAEDSQIPEKLKVPIVYPLRKYLGACNVETVKDGECESALGSRC